MVIFLKFVNVNILRKYRKVSLFANVSILQRVKNVYSLSAIQFTLAPKTISKL